MKIVVDCNLIVSAAFFKPSVPHSVVNFIEKSESFLFSADTFSELKTVLLRPKFDKYASENDRLLLLARLLEKGLLINPTEKIVACRDPKDDMYLELAVAGKADCIITGDKALKDLHPFRGIPILTAAEFKEQFM